MNIELSVIIPAFNEEEEIADSLKEVLEFLKKKKISHEILVVDDGSRDNTTKVVTNLIKKNRRIKLIKNKSNIGKGGAIKRGALAAKGKYILFTDVDLSAPIEQYFLFRKYLKKGFEVVFGSRYLKESKVNISQPFHRRYLGKGFYFLVQNFILKDVKDTNCGFKAYTKRAARLIFKRQTLSGWGFDTELLFIAKKLHLKMKEVPIEWNDSSYSKVQIIPAIFVSLGELIRLKVNSIRGLYNN